MPNYIKKPVMITAVEYTGVDDPANGDLRELLHSMGSKARMNPDGTLSILTLEGVMTAQYGDYIIKGVEGEMYPCKPDIFHKTYRPVDDEAPRTYEYLEDFVLHWAKEKGILEKGTPMGQGIKTMEECNELLDGINSNDEGAIKDAIGDIIVTVIIQAKMQGLSSVECLDSAYREIAGRTGKMVDGVFVKDE